MDELVNLIHQLNVDKVSLWKQMRIIEIVSAVIAERLLENGTQFIIDPDQVIWPDGKITKIPTPQKKAGVVQRRYLAQVRMVFLAR